MANASARHFVTGRRESSTHHCVVLQRRSRVRILMVNSHAASGGAARMALTLVRALNALGQEADLYHCGDAVKAPPLYGMRRLGSRQMNAVLARCGSSLAVRDMGVARDIGRVAESADV